MKPISLSLSGTGANSGKKKPVFKSLGKPGQTASIPAPMSMDVDSTLDDSGMDPELRAAYEQDPSQAETNGWHMERYDPRFPSNGQPLNLNPSQLALLNPSESWEDSANRTMELLVEEGKIPASMLPK
jgi:hypothetical protein